MYKRMPAHFLTESRGKGGKRRSIGHVSESSDKLNHEGISSPNSLYPTSNGHLVTNYLLIYIPSELKKNLVLKCGPLVLPSEGRALEFVRAETSILVPRVYRTFQVDDPIEYYGTRG